jgi:hypothetical protein
MAPCDRVQQPQIALFCFLKITAGMVSRRALQELQEKFRRLAIARIGRNVPAFTPEQCGGEQYPVRGLSSNSNTIAAIKITAAVWKS